MLEHTHGRAGVLIFRNGVNVLLEAVLNIIQENRRFVAGNGPGRLHVEVEVEVRQKTMR